MHMDLPIQNEPTSLIILSPKSFKFFRPMMSKDNLYRTENLPVHSTYHVLVALSYPFLCMLGLFCDGSCKCAFLKAIMFSLLTCLAYIRCYCSYAYNYHCGQGDTPWQQTAEMHALWVICLALFLY
jgi:hypothetical protein